MNVDDITRRVLKEVVIGIQEYRPIEISEEEILDIVDSQIKGASYGLKKGVSIRLPILGRFLFSNRKDVIRRTHEFRKMKDFYSEIEYNQLDLEARINTIKEHKARWRKEEKEKLTVIELVKKPNISNGRIIYDKLSRLLEDGR